MNPHIYVPLIFDKGAKTIQWGKQNKTVYSTNGAGSFGGQHVEDCKLTHSYYGKCLKSRTCMFPHLRLSSRGLADHVLAGNGQPVFIL